MNLIKNISRKVTLKVITSGRIRAQNEANTFIKNNPELNALKKHYKSHSTSTGVSAADVKFIYNRIIERKYKSIIEFGSGHTTGFIALALKHLWENSSEKPKFVTYESQAQYFENAKKCLPEELHEWVDFKLSPRVRKNFGILHGVAYEEVSHGPFDLAFVDGPPEKLDNLKLFSLDILNVLEAQDLPIDVLVDSRMRTMMALKLALRPGTVKFSAVQDMGILDQLHKDDLVVTSNGMQNFRDQFNRVGLFNL